MSAVPPQLWVAPGTLLAAGPGMLDPNFMHTVVLVCQHAAEGALGFVVNRRVPHSTQEAFPEHPLLGQVDLPIYQGGPVQLDSLQFLHRAPDALPDSVEIADDLHWGGNPGSLAVFLAGQRERALVDLRLLVGYTGWGAGQLDSELREGVWLPSPSRPDAVFDDDIDTLWRRVVDSIGPPAEGFSSQPPHPSWN